MLDSILALAENRLELVSVELQQEKWRLVDLLLRVAGAMVLALLALATATATMVYLLWPVSPLGALAGLTVLYAMGALLLFRGVQKRLNSGSKPFASTLAEFQRDCECLRPKD
jgi:uncharacterized membrane protein YqjE